SPNLIDEMRKAPDDVLSFQEALQDSLQIEYTLGKSMHRDPYQVAVVRGALTRNIGVKFMEVQDEIVASFNELIPVQDDWITVNLNSNNHNKSWRGQANGSSQGCRSVAIPNTLQVAASVFHVQVP
ncbi:hypothetical protein MPER_13699, partial [Moniliophthora perniciosa FA553]